GNSTATMDGTRESRAHLSSNRNFEFCAKHPSMVRAVFRLAYVRTYASRTTPAHVPSRLVGRFGCCLPRLPEHARIPAIAGISGSGGTGAVGYAGRRAGHALRGPAGLSLPRRTISPWRRRYRALGAA